MKYNNKKIRLLVVVSLVLLITNLGLIVNGESAKVIVVASTSWTAAMAKAAGADEVRILAPFELKHPAEYDYKPSDIAKLNEASAIVYAGYELFIPKITEATNFPSDRMIKVITQNDPTVLKQQLSLIAEKLGTQSRLKTWLEQFEAEITRISKGAEKERFNQKRVLVQQHQVPTVKWLGYDIIGTFGEEELTPTKALEYAKLKPDLIIDNYHTQDGKVLAELVKCDYKVLINFPLNNNIDLLGVFKENAERLGLKLE